MDRNRACLKCRTSKPGATFESLEVCPNCGAIYAKVEAAMATAAVSMHPTKRPKLPLGRVIAFATLATLSVVFISALLSKSRPADDIGETSTNSLATAPIAGSPLPAPPPATESEALPEPRGGQDSPQPSSLTQTEDPEFDAARKALIAIAKDPDSVQFRNLEKVPGTSNVCGEYNARNGFGGYNGFKKFWVDDPSKEKPIVVTDEGQTTLASIICNAK